MRPVEVLSLIEEASGTSSYLAQKEQAIAVIKKKEAKLADTERILAEEVEPKYQRMLEDKSNFDNFKKLSEEIEQKKRLYLAHKFCQLKVQVEETGASRKDRERQVTLN